MAGVSSRSAIAIVAVALMALLALAAPAAAEFEIESFDGSILDAGGVTFTQAGGHPDQVTTTFIFTKTTAANGNPAPSGAVKDIAVELPPGLIGNPTAVPRCSQADFAAGATGNCPKASQVGINTLLFNYNQVTEQLSGFTAPVYNLVPRPGVAAEFGFRFATNTITIEASVRTGGDYGVTMRLANISQGLGLFGNVTTFWGVPAAHNEGGWEPKPFISLPTSCLGPQTTTLRADSWQAPGVFRVASFLSHDTLGIPVGTTGCELLSFDPSLTMRPDTTAAASPSGLDVEVALPQPEGANVPAEAHLKDATVTLPEGFALNPSSVNGLASCSPAQADLSGPDPMSCPDAAKVGNVEIESPLLDDPVRGGVYLATPHDNPFGSLVALYVSAVDPRSGTVIKLPGRVDLDPSSGRLTASFDDNPQLPFESFRLRFFGGPRAPLTTPPACGSYEASGTFTPWSGTPPVSTTSSFQITSGPGGGPCPNGSFEPRLEAGSANPVAGAHSPFLLRVTRESGAQELSRITARLPRGLLARLAGIPYCPDAALASIPSGEGTAAKEIANPSCPAASQVGRVTVGAGAGPNPFYLDTGKAYLAGPYRGAPLSIAFVTPVLAGPFDLGNVVVRAALEVDPRTAQVTAVSDPLPRILHGIPLQIREVRVNLDRDQFTRNPTSCEPTSVGSLLTSTQGASASLSTRFQVGSCASLRFKPKLKLELKGATRRSGHPSLKAVVTFPKQGAHANIARAQVGLPPSEFLDQGNLDKVCKQADLHAGTCPKESIYGRAKAWTPLLDKPLEGPVHLAVGFGYKLPALVADLNGQIRILLVGRIDTTKRKGIRNTFEVVPDAPVSRFELRMKGGRQYGLLENSENVCRKKQRASAVFVGHNGDRLQLRPVISNGCGKKKQAKKHRQR